MRRPRRSKEITSRQVPGSTVKARSSSSASRISRWNDHTSPAAKLSGGPASGCTSSIRISGNAKAPSGGGSSAYSQPRPNSALSGRLRRWMMARAAGIRVVGAAALDRGRELRMVRRRAVDRDVIERRKPRGRGHEVGADVRHREVELERQGVLGAPVQAGDRQRRAHRVGDQRSCNDLDRLVDLDQVAAPRRVPLGRLGLDQQLAADPEARAPPPGRACPAACPP